MRRGKGRRFLKTQNVMMMYKGGHRNEFYRHHLPGKRISALGPPLTQPSRFRRILQSSASRDPDISTHTKAEPVYKVKWFNDEDEAAPGT